MDALIKLEEIAVHMDLEPAEETGLATGPSAKVAPCGQVVDGRKKHEELGVFRAQIGGGKTVPLLKTLLTSACERNCNYCPFRAGRNYRRSTFSPEEMARTFMDMHRAGLVDGLFLSSGIIGGGLRTQDKLLATAEILRRQYQFRGYLHLKVMPGAERAQVEHAMSLVDRLSVNLEAPTDRRLSELAPLKQFEQELLRPLRWIEDIRRTTPSHHFWQGRAPSTTTQFVVGGGEESDVELLLTTAYLSTNMRLRRAYFSAFRPVPDTPLENRAAEDPLRQHRLYQASFLLRDYGFDVEDLHFGSGGRLPLDQDPKLSWAEANLYDRPVELNRASREELLRVPGIGPKSAASIVNARRLGSLRHLQDLQKIGVATKRLEPFVLLDGYRPDRQLRLF